MATPAMTTWMAGRAPTSCAAAAAATRSPTSSSSRRRRGLRGRVRGQRRRGPRPDRQPPRHRPRRHRGRAGRLRPRSDLRRRQRRDPEWRRSATTTGCAGPMADRRPRHQPAFRRSRRRHPARGGGADGLFGGPGRPPSGGDGDDRLIGKKGADLVNGKARTTESQHATARDLEAEQLGRKQLEGAKRMRLEPARAELLSPRASRVSCCGTSGSARPLRARVEAQQRPERVLPGGDPRRNPAALTALRPAQVALEPPRDRAQRVVGGLEGAVLEAQSQAFASASRRARAPAPTRCPISCSAMK